jgi:hypothetical protein
MKTCPAKFVSAKKRATGSLDTPNEIPIKENCAWLELQDDPDRRIAIITDKGLRDSVGTQEPRTPSDVVLHD